MQVPVCGPEPEYYNVYENLGRTVSSEWWTWRQCQDEVGRTTTVPYQGKPADTNFHGTAYDTNFLAENSLVISGIVVTIIAIIVIYLLLQKANHVELPSDNDTVDPSDPTDRLSSTSS
jgi:hypothetical protein